MANPKTADPKTLAQTLRPRLLVKCSALQQNFRTLQQKAGSANIACTVKADAYGLGLEAVAKSLRTAGAGHFFVAYDFEAVALRHIIGAGPSIYVFNGPCPQTISSFTRYQLIPVLNSLDQINLWQTASTGPCVIHVDTGMNRLGLDPADFAALLDAPPANLDVRYVLSHFACASDHDAPQNAEQVKNFNILFKKAQTIWPQSGASLSASAGLFLPLFAPGTEQLVRPGLALYGGGPQDAPEPSLQTVACLQAPIVQMRTIKAGQSVGYGARFTAEKPTRLATLALGYGDGFSRAHSDKAYVHIKNHLCPLVGRVSMDMVVADISALEETPSIGDYGELFGTHIPIEQAAERIGTIAYELIVNLGPRVTRVYC